MKRCPKCSTDYFDNMLEFCLEDGTRLSQAAPQAATTAPFAHSTSPAGGPIGRRVSEETVVISADRSVASESQSGAFGTARFFETVPIVIALAHNWWQWLYLERAYVSSITDFILSANFLMWLLLLTVGTILGIFSVKRSENKTFGIVSLVVLAINLLLYIVPRR